MFTCMELRSMNPLNGLSPAQSVAGSLRGFSMPREIWKPVYRYKGKYEVSSLGRVRSVDGTIIKPTLSGRYFRVSLKRCVGNRKNFTVHTLVLEAFHRPKPKGKEARHIDGDSHNNHYRNLKWGTSKENAADRKRHGTLLTGELCNLSKLNWKKVDLIRKTKMCPNKLAEKFGVKRRCIVEIRNFKRWIKK